MQDERDGGAGHTRSPAVNRGTTRLENLRMCAASPLLLHRRPYL